MANDSLAHLTAQVREFADARDWQQFHSPKNLAAAMTVEAGEVLEHFQWLTEGESESLGVEKRSEVEVTAPPAKPGASEACEPLKAA